ncbi:hypothetical protein Tco_0110782 [Tanacetum coccineum]
MAHIRNAIMEEHRASMEAYRKVHNETVRSELRMAMVQQSMEMDMWEIKEKLAERREQMGVRAYEEEKSDKVTKELNDVGLKGVHVIGSDVADAPKSANNQDNRNTTWAGDQSRVPEKDVPSHGLRKQELGYKKEEHGIHGLLSINQKDTVMFQQFELLEYHHAKKAVQRKVWDLGITHRDFLKQHLEDKKANKKSFKVKGKGKVNGNGKDKQVYIPKPKTLNLLLKRTQLRMTPATTARRWAIGRGTVLCILLSCLRKISKLVLPVLQGFREARKLKQRALYLYVVNGVRAQVKAIGSFDLVLPNGQGRILGCAQPRTRP